MDRTLKRSGTFFHKSTVPTLDLNFVRSPSGLLLPFRRDQESSALLSTHKFVLWSQISGGRLEYEEVVARIAGFEKETFIMTAIVLQELSYSTRNFKIILEKIRDLDSSLANEIERTPEFDGAILASQSFLTLILIAFKELPSPREKMAVTELDVITVALQIQDHLGSAPELYGESSLEIEILANYSFQKRFNLAFNYQRWQRWWGNSSQKVAKEYRKLFSKTVGASIARAVELVSGTSVMYENTPILIELNPDDSNTVDYLKILQRISLDGSGFRDKINATDSKIAESHWNFSLFEEFPVYQISETRFVVLHREMFQKRLLGWGSILDASLSCETKSETKKFFNEIEMEIERIVIEELKTALNTADKQVVLEEREYISILGGAGIRVADVLLDYGNQWISFEISARRAKYQGRYGHSVEDYNDILKMVLDEADQAISLAEQVIKVSKTPNPEFRPVSTSIEVFPVVLLTEDFPTNVLTLERLRKIITEKYATISPQVRSLEVINYFELYMLLEECKTTGLTLPEILKAKQSSKFSADSINNYLNLNNSEIS